MVSDTIGFIRNLPPGLIQAFTSTLNESIHAEILLHVIDVSDRDKDAKIATVESILEDIHVANKYKIYVFNKIDVAKNLDKEALILQYSAFHPIFLSAKSEEGIESLMNFLSQKMGEI